MKNRFFFFFWWLGLSGGLSAQKFIVMDSLTPPDYELNSISVVNDQVVWAVASGFASVNHLNKVIRTIDGGRSWQAFDVEAAKGNISLDIVGRSKDEAWI